MKKRWISFLVILGLTAGLAGCGTQSSQAAGDTKKEDTQTAGDAKTQEVQTVRLGVMTGNSDHWVAEVGTEQGIFEKYGIELKVTEFAAGINTIDAIVTDQVDIGNLADYAAINRLGNTQDDTDLRLIANFSSSSTGKLYVNPKEVTSLTDLSGKGLVTLAGTVWDYWNAKTLEQAGIEGDQQVLVNVDSAQAALGVMTTGEGVAFWASGTNAKKLEEAGMEPLLTMDELGLRTDAYFITTEKYIEDNKELLTNYLKAFQETQDWVLENQEEAAEIVEEKTGIPQDQFLENLKQEKLLVGFSQDTKEHLNEIKDWALKAGRFEKDFELDDFVDTTLLENGGFM